MEITNHKQLQAAIAALKQTTEIKKQVMVDQFRLTYENHQPANFIKNQFKKLLSFETPTDPTGTAMGFGAGLLSKKIYEGSAPNIVQQFLGSALEFGVAKVVANNSDKIKEVASNFIDKLFTPKSKERDNKAKKQG
jgi:hypothetical protein